MVRITLPTLPDPALRDTKYLASQERLVMMVRLHWAVLLKVFAQTVGAIILALVVNILLATHGGGDGGGGFITSILWYFALFMILRMLWRVTDWHFDHLMITDKRLLKVSGILKREVKTMPLGKITDMSYNRDPLGRVLGYGEFVVESAGQDQALSRIKYLPRPDRLYLTLCDMTFGGAPSPAGDG
jgi:membrane protein YdbS with pleckstrin-like domain